MCVAVLGEGLGDSGAFGFDPLLRRRAQTAGRVLMASAEGEAVTVEKGAQSRRRFQLTPVPALPMLAIGFIMDQSVHFLRRRL